MLPCGALERSNNPYIESIVWNLVFLRIRKRSWLCYVKLLLFKKDFKIAELVLKYPYFIGRPKNGEGNKQRRRRMYMRKSN